MKKRCQASLETILVLSLIVIFLIYILSMNQQLMSNTEKEYTLQKMRFTLDTLVQSADIVYGQGIGAKMRVRLAMPAHIQKINIGNRTINVTINLTGRVSEIFRTVPYQLNGSLPTDQGNYWFMLEAHRDLVEIQQD